MRNWIKKALLYLSGVALLSSCSSDEPATKADSDKSPKRISTEITLEEARADLEKLLDEIDTPDSRSGQNPRTISNAYSVPMHEYASRSEDSDSLMIHIFNFDDNQGYAIMSGDVRVPSLLALTYSGSLPEDEEVEVPEGVAIFLEGLESTFLPEDDDTRPVKFKPIDNSDPGDLPSGDYDEYGDWENIVYKQNGYCPVKWTQGHPYNNYCPIRDGEHAPTGCVPTAVAQLMAIYKYPNTYKGYTFYWDEMVASDKIWKCSQKAQESVARLMQQLGTKNNLDVEYGNSSKGSGAKPQNIPRTLQAFGYSQPGSLVKYNTESVVSELKQGYAVLAGGKAFKHTHKVLGIKYNTTYSGGHRWLLHGVLERRREVRHYYASGKLNYTTTYSQWYVLCNWGWSGLNDGYFLSEVFDSDAGPEFPDNEPSSRAESEDDEISTEGTDRYFQFDITVVSGIRK